MATQETYNQYMRPAVAGAQADMTPSAVISRNVEDAEAIGFGVVVQQGERDRGCTATLTGMTATTYLGITLRDRSVAAGNGFGQYESARIMNKGTIWVAVGAAVNAGDAVTVTLESGAVGNAAVGAGVVAIPDARFETSTSGAGLAVVRLG